MSGRPARRLTASVIQAISTSTRGSVRAVAVEARRDLDHPAADGGRAHRRTRGARRRPRTCPGRSGRRAHGGAASASSRSRAPPRAAPRRRAGRACSSVRRRLRGLGVDPGVAQEAVEEVLGELLRERRGVHQCRSGAPGSRGPARRAAGRRSPSRPCRRRGGRGRRRRRRCRGAPTGRRRRSGAGTRAAVIEPRLAALDRVGDVARSGP